jgi:hypothetical protein
MNLRSRSGRFSRSSFFAGHPRESIESAAPTGHSHYQAGHVSNISLPELSLLYDAQFCILADLNPKPSYRSDSLFALFSVGLKFERLVKALVALTSQ